MRPDAVTAFMDRFGDVVYNSYNATEAGIITAATPADLRAAPDTAGRPVVGTEIRIVDDDGRHVADGEVGRITVRNDSQFEGYTSGDTKEFDERYMVSGDVGRRDAEGRLYVVGRDDEMIVSGRRERLPARGRGDARRARGGARGGGDRCRRRAVRPAAGRVRRPRAGPRGLDATTSSGTSRSGWPVTRCRATSTVLDELPRNASGKVMKRDLGPGGLVTWT